jgi:hypothetical protein
MLIICFAHDCALHAGWEVLEFARIMLGRQPHMQSLVSACSEILRPESNCSVDVRMQALICE